MKTVKEIKEKITTGFSYDIMRFGVEDISFALSFDDVKEFLSAKFLSNPNAAEEWEQNPNRLRTDEDVIRTIKNYVYFAQGKIDDQRGLSADRSCHHFIAWFWLIDEDFSDKLVDAYTHDYAPYGQPILDRVRYWLKEHSQKRD